MPLMVRLFRVCFIDLYLSCLPCLGERALEQLNYSLIKGRAW